MQLKQKLIIPRPELIYKTSSKASVDILKPEKELYVCVCVWYKKKTGHDNNVIVGFISQENQYYYHKTYVTKKMSKMTLKRWNISE